MDNPALQEHYQQLRSGHFVKITANGLGIFTGQILESDECEVLWTLEPRGTLEESLRRIQDMFGLEGEYL